MINMHRRPLFCPRIEEVSPVPYDPSLGALRHFCDKRNQNIVSLVQQQGVTAFKLFHISLSVLFPAPSSSHISLPCRVPA
jgi:hypothetical protein